MCTFKRSKDGKEVFGASDIIFASKLRGDFTRADAKNAKKLFHLLQDIFPLRFTSKYL